MCITNHDTMDALLNSVHILLLFVLRRRDGQVAAGRRGLAAARGPPAAAALASPPGVHAQPHSGWPDLGADWPRPAPLGAPALLGARRHPSQHEAAGEWFCSAWERDPLIKIRRGKKAKTIGWKAALRAHTPRSLAALDALVWSAAEEKDLWDTLQGNHQEQFQRWLHHS